MAWPSRATATPCAGCACRDAAPDWRPTGCEHDASRPAKRPADGRQSTRWRRSPETRARPSPMRRRAAGSRPRPHEGQRLIGFPAIDGSHDVEPRDDRPVIVRRPAHEGEDLTGSETRDAAPFVEEGSLDRIAKAQPMFDFLRPEGQINMGQIAGRTTNIECILTNREEGRGRHDGSPGSGILLRDRRSLSAR